MVVKVCPEQTVLKGLGIVLIEESTLGPELLSFEHRFDPFPHALVRPPGVEEPPRPVVARTDALPPTPFSATRLP